MKQSLIKFFAVLLFSAICLNAASQAKIYTRKERLAHFNTSTTKIIIGGGSFMDTVFKEEVNTNWRISPYEYCTQEEYLRDKNSSDFYFLSLTRSEGIVFLTLTKGGKENETDDLKKPFEVVSMPVASYDDPTGQELVYLGAYLDIIQRFVEDSMQSDKIGYTGLKYYNAKSYKGKRIILNPEEVSTCYADRTPDTLLGISISPGSVSFKTYSYKMLISADTHELMYFNKTKYTGPKDAGFSEKEIKSIDSRYGIIFR